MIHMHRVGPAGEYYKRYLLERYFSTRNLAVAPQDKVNERPIIHADTVFNYAQDIRQTVEIYYRVHNPHDSDFSSAQRIVLEQVRRIGGRNAIALLIAALMHVGDRKKSESEVLSLLKRVERFQFLMSVRARASSRDIDLSVLATDLVKDKESVASVSDKIHKFCEENSAITELNEPFYKWSGERGYYSWRGLKYFLFEYEQNLRKKSKSTREKLIWEDFVKEDFESDYRTIEHIFPQKATSPYWKDRFNDLGLKHRNVLRHSLGNLLAVSHPKNSSLGNLPFDVKREGRADIPGYRQARVCGAWKST